MYPFFRHRDKNCGADCARFHRTRRTGTGIDTEKETLDAVTPGRHAAVSALLCSGSIRRRLLDLGMVPGTRVVCIGRSHLGDPSAYLVRGAVIALRRKDCRQILITGESADTDKPSEQSPAQTETTKTIGTIAGTDGNSKKHRRRRNCHGFD